MYYHIFSCLKRKLFLYLLRLIQILITHNRYQSMHRTELLERYSIILAKARFSHSHYFLDNWNSLSAVTPHSIRITCYLSCSSSLLSSTWWSRLYHLQWPQTYDVCTYVTIWKTLALSSSTTRLYLKTCEWRSPHSSSWKLSCRHTFTCNHLFYYLTSRDGFDYYDSK